MHGTFKTPQGSVVFTVSHFCAVKGTRTVRKSDITYFKNGTNFGDLPESDMFTSGFTINSIADLSNAIYHWTKGNE